MKFSELNGRTFRGVYLTHFGNLVLQGKKKSFCLAILGEPFQASPLSRENGLTINEIEKFPNNLKKLGVPLNKLEVVSSKISLERETLSYEGNENLTFLAENEEISYFHLLSFRIGSFLFVYVIRRLKNTPFTKTEWMIFNETPGQTRCFYFWKKAEPKPKLLGYLKTSLLASNKDTYFEFLSLLEIQVTIGEEELVPQEILLQDKTDEKISIPDLGGLKIVHAENF